MHHSDLAVPRPDLTAGASVLALLEAFYVDLSSDSMLAPYFADLDMPAHMARIASFWDTAVFDTGGYTGNVFEPHRRMPGLAAPHFARWLTAFERTVDARHSGECAERAKATAHRIAWMMQRRLDLVPEGAMPEPEATRALLTRRQSSDAR